MKSSKGRKPLGLGGRAEDVACLYLRTKGYKVLERNYRTKFGETDIVAEDLRKGILVFVEVKSLAGPADSLKNLLPEDNLSWMKLRKLQRMCQFFANKYPELVGEAGWRIDLVAVAFVDGKKSKIRHYENI